MMGSYMLRLANYRPLQAVQPKVAEVDGLQPKDLPLVSANHYVSFPWRYSGAVRGPADYRAGYGYVTFPDGLVAEYVRVA